MNVRVRIGAEEIELEDVVSGLRGGEIEEIARDILTDMGERRLKQWKPRLNIYAHAEDIAEWDNVLMNRYCMVYTTDTGRCNDCMQGPCSGATGLCGLQMRAHTAKMSLREACKGLCKQLAVTGELFEFAIRMFSPDREIDMGSSITYPALNTSMLTGFHIDKIRDAGRALSYAQSQLSELLLSAYFGNERMEVLEEKALHAGALTLLVMEIAEVLKMCCFDFINAGKHAATEYHDFPAAEIEVGMGAVDTSRPVVLFIGNNFLPAWFAVKYLRDTNQEDKVEICGAGAVGHDLPRFYNRAKVLTSGVKARKAIRAGIADVVVLSGLCYEFDVLGDAKRADTIVIASGYTEVQGMRVIDPEKAGELAVRLAIEHKAVRKKRAFSAEELSREAKRCKRCDKCFSVCPERIAISGALAQAANGDLEALAVAYDNCLFCVKCEQVCPEGIRITELMIGAASLTGKGDRYLMRAGRGPMSELEWRDLTFGIILGGNGPGMVNIIGCGSAPEREVADMARYFLERNYLVCVAGCVAAEVAKYMDEDAHKCLFEQYIAAGVLKGLVNFGGCSAISHVPAAIYRGALVGSGYTPRANWTQVVDYLYARLPVVVILWGAETEDMYAVASGLVRAGIPVVVGPSGFRFVRFMLGDKYDRERWWMYDGITGDKKEVEPCPLHMLVPVETKEEAIAMSAKLLHRPLALRDPRLASLEAANESHTEFFGEYPDDWHLYVRSEQELHVMRRMELLRKLEREHGWEIEGMRIKRARHRSGELMDMEEYNKRYGIQLGRYSTLVPRLITR